MLFVVLTIINANVRMHRESTANAAIVQAGIAELCPGFRWAIMIVVVEWPIWLEPPNNPVRSLCRGPVHENIQNEPSKTAVG